MWLKLHIMRRSALAVCHRREPPDSLKEREVVSVLTCISFYFAALGSGDEFA